VLIDGLILLIQFLAIFILCVGIGQLLSSIWGLKTLSLGGFQPYWGYSLGLGLLSGGSVGLFIIPVSGWGGILMVIIATPLAILLLLVTGSIIKPPIHPDDQLFSAYQAKQVGCQRVEIPDRNKYIPAYLLKPHQTNGAAICIVPGAGDNKHGFKWRLVQHLLKAGFVIISIDPPGHGEYRHTPMSYPDCLSTIPAVITYLRNLAGIKRIGFIGISMGGALTLNGLATINKRTTIDALVICATPTRLLFNKTIFWREVWHTLRSPTLSIFREISAFQLHHSWQKGGMQSRHTLFVLFRLFNPLKSISQLPSTLPIYLVYSHRDGIAPVKMGREMSQAAPQARLLETKKASHVWLTLDEPTLKQIVKWLSTQLTEKIGD